MMSETIAKKSLGQHWLTDQATLQDICDAAVLSKNDVVLEIGPGQGTLTKLLVERAKQVIAVELDEGLAAGLRKDIQADNLSIENGDILQFDLNTLPKNYKVVANIPYYLTSNLLRVLCESENPFVLAILLVQKEVAERVCAKPGQMGLLSVSVQFYCETILGQIIPSTLFSPPPKVDSRMLILKKHDQPLFPGVDKKVFFRLVKAGFSQRRKTLLNSLASGLIMSKQDVTVLLNQASLQPSQRPQTLSLSDWHRLYVAWQQTK